MSPNFRRSVLALLVSLILPASSFPTFAAWPRDEVERRVEDLLGRMTLDEKIGQLQQLDGEPVTGEARPEHFAMARAGKLGSLLNVRGVAHVNAIQKAAVEGSRLKIPLLLGFDVIHGYRTIFPTPLGLAASWDPAAAERASQVAAKETAAAGVKWTFAPMVDIARDPRWGRISEGAGEDPFLGAAMARAQVRGFQGDDPAANDRVMACVKHWVAYGAAEGGRDYNTTDLSPRTLRTVYFPPFRAALEAGAGSVMSSFNDLNGVPASGNPFTLNEVLRGEWRFDGPVVSDYQSVSELIIHGLAADEAEAARLAINAGVDLEMVSRLYAGNLPRLVEDGRVSTATIDEAVRRLLRAKTRLGLFEKPFADEAAESGAFLTAENRSAAKEVAARSIVLLKDEGKLLPLGSSVKRVALIGPLADDRDAPLSHWRGDGKPEDVVTLLAALKAKVQSRDGLHLEHARGCAIDGGDTSGFAEAVDLAKRSDVAILALGESSAMSGEAACRSILDLPGHQQTLLNAVQETGTPVAVVLFNGRPLTLGPVVEKAAAILEAWLPGTEGGPAIAEILLGDANPGGKLPATFPRSVGQIPLYYNHANTGRPASVDNKYTSKYLDVAEGPLFPFGHGLSYTEFRLADLKLERSTIAPSDTVAVSVEVKNVGDRAGDEVVQLYLRDLAASMVRPVRELCGFERVGLAPGETKTVRFVLGPEQLGLYDRASRFVVEPGQFRLFAGTSSVGGLETTLTVEGAQP